MNPYRVFNPVVVLLTLCVLSGCVAPPSELEQENARLRDQIDGLQAQLQDLLESGQTSGLVSVDTFTVGLAAAEKNFDERAFLQLLMDSLKNAAEESSFKVAREADQNEIDKIEGMLAQQYLAAEKVPIVITNLSYQVQEADRDFKIGGRVVPRSSARFQRSPSGRTVTAAVADPLTAEMSRDSRGRYSIAYEEMGGGSGRIPIKVNELELMDDDEKARSARQGDISFNWNLNLAKVIVYRVDSFKGDVGAFLRRMRYPGIRTSISRYQTMRDSVFLFGYGNYVTRLVNQIRTPSDIDSVDVMPIDDVTFAELEDKGGLPEPEIMEILGGGERWVSCEFVDFMGDEKIWERPAEIPFPFVSRQISGDKRLVFYTMYDSKGAVLIGDFERGTD